MKPADGMGQRTPASLGDSRGKEKGGDRAGSTPRTVPGSFTLGACGAAPIRAMPPS